MVDIRIKLVIIVAAIFTIASCEQGNIYTKGRFNIKKDLLLANYDCKTDVDDLHSIAGFVTLVSHKDYSRINYHAVAGTYGTQDGLYVPPNKLFDLAFGNNWTDAHEDIAGAVEKVKPLIKEVINNGGKIWIAEAGQSDFSAALIQSVKEAMSDTDVSVVFQLVQHSDWNEEVTDSLSLQFVYENANYHKIPDGNAINNGTPGFRSPNYNLDLEAFTNKKLKEVWRLAIDLGNTYNNTDGRYHNEAISAGGLDFSDLSEVCWILGIDEIYDTEEFFKNYGE